MRWLRTASSSRARTSMARCLEQCWRIIRPERQSPVATLSEPSAGDHESVRPGRSFRTPRKKVSSPETNRVARNSGRIASLNAGRIGPAARIALISEAKSSSSSVQA